MTLLRDLELLAGDQTGTNPYQRFCLLGNPFPGYGDVNALVCSDQEEIKTQYVSILKQFGQDAKRLRIEGISGAGKTNVLRYLERYTNEARQRGLIGSIYPVYVSDPGDNYFVIHRQIVEKLVELFFGDLVIVLRKDPGMIDRLRAEIGPAKQLLGVIQKMLQSPQRVLFDVYGVEDERCRDAFLRWFKGERLSAEAKRFLHQPPEIDSASIAINLISGFLKVLRRLDLCEGVVLLFDEFEEIFAAPSRAAQSRYIQDLRHFLDTLVDLVFFVVATVPNPRDLEPYPAIDRRLRPVLSLKPIDSEERALEYVQDYLALGREQYFASLGKKQQECTHDPLAPFTREAIAREYRRAREEMGKGGMEVLPGYFLPRIRLLMQEMVEGEAKQFL